jgi:hypothetical protein
MVECIFNGFFILWKNIFMLEKFRKYALYFLIQKWFVFKFHNIEISTPGWDLPHRLNFFPGVLRSTMILLAIVKYKLSWLSVLSMGFSLWKVKHINAIKVYNVYILTPRKTWIQIALVLGILQNLSSYRYYCLKLGIKSGFQDQE